MGLLMTPPLANGTGSSAKAAPLAKPNPPENSPDNRLPKPRSSGRNAAFSTMLERPSASD